MERAPVTTTPADSPIRILHLSDFHFSTRSQWDADPILRALAGFIADDAAANDLYPDLVILTGDLAQSGKRSEYDLARQWLEDLWPRLTRDPAPPLSRDRLLLVPGNHDVDWSLIEPGARDAHQALLAAKTQEAVTERLQSVATRNLLFKRHAAYLKCYGTWLGEPQTLPWWQRRIRLHNQDLHVAGLDSAWLAGGDDDSRLLLGTYQINQTVLHREGEGDCEWRIALLHHPWASLAEFDRIDAQRTLHRHRDLVLRGHLHQPDLFRIVPADPRRSCIEAAAGCCYSGKPYPNAFQWIELSRDPRRVRFHFRCWHQDDWQVDRNQPGCPEGTHTVDLPAPADGQVQMPARHDTAPVPKPSAASPGGINSGPHMQSNGRSAAYNEPTPHPVPRTDDHCDVLLLYVNDKERQAIVKAFTNLGEAPAPVRPQGLACLDLGRIDGRHILAMKTNMGSATPGGAAPKTQEAITKLNPDWIIAVGVAFGMDQGKTPIGTILVSNRVSCYEPQRVGQGQPIQRGVSVPVDGKLHDFLHNVSTPPCWTGAKVRFGEILSGEKLIDDPVFKGQLRLAYPDAIGGEMEAAGILIAAHTAGGAWIIVKAVCDFADGNKGKGKEAKQTLAAANAAQFVRYALGAYQEVESAETPSSAPHASRVEIPQPPPDEKPKRRPAALPEGAEQEIRAALEASPTLCLALAKQLAMAAMPAPLAARLCDPEADFLAALDALDQALCALEKLPRLAPDEAAKQLREDALTILGWTTVGTVADGCEREDAAVVAEKWREGDVFKVPLGRGPCVEVLTARWRDGKAEFSIGTETVEASPYDLAATVMQELGFDDAEHLTPERAVDAVINRVYQEILRRPANDRPTQARRRDAPSWLRGQVRKYKRQFRLVVDLKDPLADPDVLREIARQLPDLLLILVNDQADEDASVFILPPADLTNAIRDCLVAIGKLP